MVQVLSDDVFQHISEAPVNARPTPVDTPLPTDFRRLDDSDILRVSRSL
jgi:hypothetical protein